MSCVCVCVCKVLEIKMYPVVRCWGRCHGSLASRQVNSIGRGYTSSAGDVLNVFPRMSPTPQQTPEVGVLLFFSVLDKDTVA